jgi:ribosomal protein S17E
MGSVNVKGREPQKYSTALTAADYDMFADKILLSAIARTVKLRNIMAGYPASATQDIARSRNQVAVKIEGAGLLTICQFKMIVMF